MHIQYKTGEENKEALELGLKKALLNEVNAKQISYYRNIKRHSSLLQNVMEVILRVSKGKTAIQMDGQCQGMDWKMLGLVHQEYIRQKWRPITDKLQLSRLHLIDKLSTVLALVVTHTHIIKEKVCFCSKKKNNYQQILKTGMKC